MTFLSTEYPQTSTDVGSAELRVGIAGLGTIGAEVARAIARGALPGMRLSAVAVRDRAKAAPLLAEIGDVPAVEVGALGAHADIVLECAPAAMLRSIVEPALRAERKVVILSVGTLLAHMDLIDIARACGGQIIVPTGALLGLDAVAAAAEGTIRSVRMITRKPISGLVGAPYLISNGIEISDLAEPLRIFEGSAREAATGFPANLNVAVALSLAGIGPDRTQLEIWADPTVKHNTHRIMVESDSALIDMTIQNVPSCNPKTGRITALSVLAVLRKLQAPLRVGT